LGIAKWGAKQDTAGAVHDFEMASKLGGVAKGIFANQFLLLFGAPKYAEAVKKYVGDEIRNTTDSLKLSYLYASISLINDQMNNEAEIQSDLDKARRFGPKNPAVYLITGALGKKLNHSPEMILQNYNKAIVLNDTLRAAFLMKGYFYHNQGDTKLGCDNLKKAEQLGAKISTGVREYVCNGKQLANKKDSPLQFVIYPYLREAIVNLERKRR
jgi:hypothetical protein